MHARLFDASKLQTLINAAALWQVASVLVAQKHLADITKKLEEIRSAVQGISQFLDNQRKARIQSGFAYLGQVHAAISKGELPSSVRNELESLERDLLEIQDHLEREYVQQMNKQVEGDTFGTKELTDNMLGKLSDLDALAEDISTCLKTRIAAWHVFSLYPGELHLKESRKETIVESIKRVGGLSQQLYVTVERELEGLKSFWNKKSTLDERKSHVRDRRAKSDSLLSNFLRVSHDALRQTEQLLLEYDRPTRLMLTMDGGRVLEARQL